MQTSTHYLICLLQFISPFLTSIYRCDQYTIMKTKILQFFPHRFILLVVFIPSLCLGLETDTISRGLVMKDPDTIVSSRNMFKLGFFSPENTTNRYLAIFFAFSEQTAIWIANRDKPLTDSSGAVTISRDGNLVLINGRNQTVWSTNAAASTNTSLQILDTGNLLLRNLATGDTIWDSFSNLTDVLLPGMTLTYNTHSGRQAILSSWKNATDPATGSFTAGIESVNTLQLVIRNEGRLHWRSGPWNGMLFIGIKEMFYSYLDGFNQVRNDSAGNFYYMLPDSKYLVKVSLSSSGNSLRMHWNDQTKRWDTVWVAPGNRCDVYGMCGPFGSCSVEDSPICSCLRGFEPINRDEWERGNWSSGCQRKRQLKCDAGDEDKFLRLQFMKVPNFGETFYSRVEDECRSRCLGNCSCVAYVHDTSLGCILWHGDLIDIQKFSGVGVDLFLRLSASEFGSHKDRKMYIIIPVVVTFVCLLLLVFAAWCWTAKKKGQKVKDRDILQVGQMFSSDSTAIVLKDESEKVNIGELPSFTFDMLAEATDQFHENNLLGRGGFGPVYKGNLGNGKEIAVKRLSADSGQGVEEFMNEVIVISKLQHRNLVRLLGGCVEKEEKMLVYEYMPNKSLDVCLFDGKEGPSKKVLEWAKRISIIEGIGRGLLYLHKDSRLRIIHRDLKPSNVLLDKDWNPKISDFGMARIFGGNQDHGNTARVVGTYGYMAPEYAMEGRFSEKSDVYSFGVLILEIVKGRKNTSYYNREWCLSLVGYAWKLWSEGNGCGFVDESIGSSGLEEEMVRCVQIGLLCVQEFPKDRPTVQTILSMLTREIVDLPMPEQPIFADKNWNASATGSTQPANRVGLSINELTLTELHGR